MVVAQVDTQLHPIDDAGYIAACKEQLDGNGVLVLDGFFRPEAVSQIVAESKLAERDVFYAGSTHNVYLTPPDPSLPDDHPFNRQVVSSKGLIADDQVPDTSPLRAVYDATSFRSFLCGVLGIDAIYPYADSLSSINVHFAGVGRELGWHFDNSSFAVTMLLQKPAGGSRFEYVPDVRDADAGEMGFEKVEAVLDGQAEVATLEFEPGALVLFRGRNAMHRVTPTEGDITRLLAVFAYNDKPDVQLSDSALKTFFGRTS